ncbi:hypothetical protein KKA47_01785, partial [bacterium]|nr:hypothetical protein [bacterium]
MVDMGLEFNPTKLIESAANLWGDIQSLAEQNQTNRTSEVRFGSNQFRTSEVRFGLDDDTKTKLPWWLVGVGTAAAATFGSSMRVTDGELSDHIKGILQDALAEHNIGDFRGAAEEYARAISAGEEKGVDPLYIIEWLIREGHEMAYAHAKDQRDIVADGKGVSPYMGAYARAIRMLRGYASQDVVSNVKRLLEDGNIDQAEAVAARFINTIEGLNSLIAQPWRGDGALTTGIPSIIQNLGGELTHQKGQYVNVLSDLKELITKENHVRELVKEGKLDQALNILRQLPLDYDQMELKRSLVRAMRTAATVKFKKGDFSGAYNDAMDARIDFKNGDLEHVQSMVLQARAQIERLKELSKPKVGEDVVRDAQKQYKEQLRVTLNAVITDINQKFGAQTESVSGPYREALAEAYELQARYEILFGDFKLAGGYLDKAEFFNRPSKIIEPIRREFRQLHKIKNSRLPSWAPAFVHKFIGEGEVAAIKYERAARKDEAKAMRISRVLSSAHFPAPVGVSQVRGISVSTDYNNRDAESRFYTRTARRLEKAAKANWRGENPVHGAELFYEAILNYELASNYDEAIRLATSVAELARKANHNSFASEMDAEVRILKEAAK